MSGFIFVVDTAADVEEEDFEFNPPPELCLPRSMAYVSMVPMFVQSLSIVCVVYASRLYFSWSWRFYSGGRTQFRLYNFFKPWIWLTC